MRAIEAGALAWSRGVGGRSGLPRRGSGRTKIALFCRDQIVSSQVSAMLTVRCLIAAPPC